MFGFLIALIIVVFFGTIVQGEKRKKTQVKVREDAYWKIQREIQRPFDKCRPPSSRDEYVKMCESIIEDLQYIFSNEWETVLNYNCIKACTVYDPREMFYHPAQIAYEVWLSRQGYVSQLFSKGYNYASIGIYEYTNEEIKNTVIRACEVIEKNLQNNHPELPLRLWTYPDYLDRHYFLRWEHDIKSFDGTLGERLW